MRDYVIVVYVSLRCFYYGCFRDASFAVVFRMFGRSGGNLGSFIYLYENIAEVAVMLMIFDFSWLSLLILVTDVRFWILISIWIIIFV